MDYKMSNQTSFLYLSKLAEAKLWALVHGFDSEVAWHGTVHKVGSGEYVLDDVLVYPQVVSGGNVETDALELCEWAQTISEDVYNSIHLQGHSHVNFGCTPSVTDRRDQKNYLDELGKDDYYIFMILNKRGESFVEIYDNQEGVFYSSDKVALMAGIGLDSFMKDAHRIATPYSPQYLKDIEDEYNFEKEESDYGLLEVCGDF